MSLRATTFVQVFVAACSGSMKLSGTIGLPIVHVDATTDAAAAVRRLDEREHGSGVRVGAMFQPIGHDEGWSDWRLFDYAPGPWRQDMGARPDGVRAVEGRLLVSLPKQVPIAEFRGELQAGLRHLRLHEVTSAMDYMAMRHDACLEYVVEPRYSWDPHVRGFRRARRCDDLYVFDPAEVPWSLFWIVVAARLAAIEGTS